MPQIDQLTTEIFTIVNTLNQQDMGSLSEDTLSRLALKVASYKASLGEHTAKAKRLAWDAEAEYYRVRAEAYKKLRADGKGATDAEELKRLDAHEAFVAWNKAKELVERLTTLSMDCHDLIDGIKSRLIVLHTEREESNVL
jgi:hypothetical protein